MISNFQVALCGSLPALQARYDPPWATPGVAHSSCECRWPAWRASSVVDFHSVAYQAGPCPLGSEVPSWTWAPSRGGMMKYLFPQSLAHVGCLSAYSEVSLWQEK